MDLRKTRQEALAVEEALSLAHQGGACGEALRRMESVGRRLFDQVLPGDLRGWVRRLEATFLSLELDQALCDLPWELFHDGTDFLGCRFAVGRRVREWESHPEKTTPPPVAGFSFLLLSDPTSDLPQARKETESLFHLLRSDDRIAPDWLNGSVSRAQATDWLGQFHAIHYSGHGEAPSLDHPGGGWRLSDGSLTASEIASVLDAQGAAPRLVFSNACHSGAISERVPPAVSQRPSDPCGLAEVFLKAGCGHFIGVLFKTPDVGSSDFARAFYQHVLDGSPMGRALLHARLEVRAQGHDPNLTWARYLLYGDPTAGLFGDVLLLPEFQTLVLAEPRSERVEASLGRTLGKEAVSLLEAFPGGRKVENREDPLLFAFPRPSDAVRFAVLLQECARASSDQASAFAFGIHGGEVLLGRDEATNAILTLEGEVYHTLATLCRMATPGQILVSRPVFDSARAVLRGRELPSPGIVRWLDHGAYRLLDSGEILGVCELGFEGRSPLVSPADSDLAKRHAFQDQDPVLGWRPALEEEIPTAREWVLMEKLGEGGFGEVWRAAHRDSGETRVFKFCFRAEKVRSLKREATLVRLLQEQIVQSDLIVRVNGFYFDEPPFYIEMEDVPGLDLAKWWKRHGDGTEVPMELRLELVARVADALQIAHDAGVIHRDVKPSNILVVGEPSDPENLLVKLTDFGIGQVVSKDYITDFGLGGFTETFSATEIASHSGSRLYTAPEVQVGRGSSIRSDIYSLGVVLFQVLVGDLGRPLTTDWRAEIADPILQEDLDKCLAGNPIFRHSSAADLADSLRRLEERRGERGLRLESERKAHRRRRLTVAMAAVGGILAAIAVALSYGLIQANRATRQAQREVYYSKIALAQEAVDEGSLSVARNLLLDSPPQFRHWEWAWLLSRCNLDQMALRGHTAPTSFVAVSNDGVRVAMSSLDGEISIWDLKTGAMSGRLESLPGTAVGISFGPGDKHLAVATRDLLRIHALESGAAIHDITDDRGFFGRIAFNPVTGILAAANGRRVIRLIDPETGKDVGSLTGHTEWITDLAFSPDGKLLASSAMDTTVRVWDLESGTEVEVIRTNNRTESAVAFSPDGELLATAGAHYGINLRKRKSLQQIHKNLPVGQFWSHLQFSPSGEQLLGNDGQTWILEVDTGRTLLRFPSGIGWFCLGGKGVVSAEGEQGVKVWRTDLHASEVMLAASPPPYSPMCVAFSPDGSQVAGGGRDFVATIYDRRTGRAIHNLPHDSEVYPLRYTPDGNQLLTGCFDGTIVSWRVSDGARLRVTPCHGNDIKAIAVSPRGDAFATGGDLTVGIWDVRTHELIHRFEPASGPVTAVAYSPDGSALLTGTDSGMIGIWDVEAGRLKKRFDHRFGTVKSLAWGPESSWAITLSGDGVVARWNTETGENLHARVGGETLVLSPDGKRLFVDSVILDPEDLRVIGRLKDIFPPVALSPDFEAFVGLTHGETLVVRPCFLWSLRGAMTDDRQAMEDRIEQTKRAFWRDILDRGGFPIPPSPPEETKGITGQWDFDRGDLAATVGRDLEYFDYDQRGTTKAKTRFGTTTSFGLPDIDGRPAAVMKFPACEALEGYKMFTNAGSNGGGALTNEYSILFDLLIPSTSQPKARALFNKNPRNQEPADFLVSATGGIGVEGRFDGALKPDAWRRVVCVVKASAPPRGWMAKYIDGVLVGAHQLASGLDARWALDRGTRGQWALLFSDRDGQTGEGYVNSIQFRNYAMSAEEVALLGGPTAMGIPNPLGAPGGLASPAVSLAGPRSIQEAGSHPLQKELGGQRVSGQWDFDHGDLRATHGRDLEFYDADGDGSTEKKVEFGACASFGLPPQGSGGEGVMRISGFDPGEGLKLFSGAIPNHGWGRVNHYAIVMDILFPSESLGKAKPLFNTTPRNTDPAELVVSETNSLCIDGDCHATFQPDVWHRLGIVVRMDTDTAPKLTTYINRDHAWTYDLNQGTDGRWSAPDGTWDQWMLLFTHDQGATGAIYVDCIQFRNYALSPGELDQLGHAAVDPIPSIGPLPPIAPWTGFRQ
ncbi:MAG: CHAT domain-containing protein [Candidatus Omnitrophica bacterium]|nr:CHAT domain-containing protein [Candidatus Omnitrophota bacterium]